MHLPVRNLYFCTFYNGKDVALWDFPMVKTLMGNPISYGQFYSYSYTENPNAYTRKWDFPMCVYAMGKSHKEMTFILGNEKNN